MSGSIEQDTGLTRGDTRILHYLVRIPWPMERVWPALATADGLARWCAPAGVLEPRLGGAVELGGLGEGRVTAWDVDRVAEYTVTAGRLRFHLERAGDTASVLRFTHEFRGAGGPETDWHPRFERLLESLDSP
ncbi:hypothetical protein AB0F77_38385 [Streptomyces sp. NPDC026672]|uniref:hypothetical protein n=1 Tax=unclassified Streptomyces TaxID=2593676 RepID=UPI0033D57F20